MVRSLGRPIPGASITAIQGDRKIVTTTDESGRYEIEGLTPGEWTLQVDMVAFAPVRRQRTLGDLAPPALDFDLQLAGSVVARQVEQPRPPAAAAPAPAAPPSKPGGAQPAQRPQRAQNGQGQGDRFRNLNVNQTADNEVLAQLNGPQADGAVAAAMGDPNAGEALLINGSVTSGLQTAQQQDFFDQRRAEFDQRRGSSGAIRRWRPEWAAIRTAPADSGVRADRQPAGQVAQVVVPAGPDSADAADRVEVRRIWRTRRRWTGWIWRARRPWRGAWRV